jgi:hypothetical protein
MAELEGFERIVVEGVNPSRAVTCARCRRAFLLYAIHEVVLRRVRERSAFVRQLRGVIQRWMPCP